MSESFRLSRLPVKGRLRNTSTSLIEPRMIGTATARVSKHPTDEPAAQPLARGSGTGVPMLAGLI